MATHTLLSLSAFSMLGDIMGSQQRDIVAEVALS
jgi:hypothetical protein